jgi:transcriptional regulator with XRE-family HTH domain
MSQKKANFICASRFALGAKSCEDVPMKTIGAVAREIRQAKKLSLADVAYSMVNYDPGNLSRFERGIQSIMLDKLEELSNVLKTPISTMFLLREIDDESQIVSAFDYDTSDAEKLKVMEAHYTHTQSLYVQDNEKQTDPDLSSLVDEYLSLSEISKKAVRSIIYALKEAESSIKTQ